MTVDEVEDAPTSSLPVEADAEVKRPQTARKSTGPRRWVAGGSVANNIRSGRVVKGRPPVRRDTAGKTLPGRLHPPVEKKKERFRPGQLALKVDNEIVLCSLVQLLIFPGDSPLPEVH